MAPLMEREADSNFPQSAGKSISERKYNLYGLLIAQWRNRLDCSVAEAQDVGPHKEHHLYCKSLIATNYSYVILNRSDILCIPLANYTIPFRLQGYKNTSAKVKCI